MIAIFLKPLILPTLSVGKIKGFRKMAKVLIKKDPRLCAGDLQTQGNHWTKAGAGIAVGSNSGWRFTAST